MTTTAEPESLVLSSHELSPPDGRRFWLDDEMFPIAEDGMHHPRFSVQEVSKCFFGKGPDWLRWRMRPDKPNKKTGEQKHPEGYFLLDGEPMQFKRLLVLEKSPDDPKKKVPAKSQDPNRSTARYYTLADIERMAHALAQNGALDGTRLAQIVLMARTCARLYGVA